MIFRLEAFACEMWLLLERAAVQYVPRLCLLTQLHVPQTPIKHTPIKAVMACIELAPSMQAQAGLHIGCIQP